MMAADDALLFDDLLTDRFVSVEQVERTADAPASEPLVTLVAFR